MGRKTTPEKKFVSLLLEIHKEHSISFGQILSQAFADYKDTFHLSEKELCYALEKFRSELALDIHHVAPEKYVEQIEDDATNHLFEGIDDDEDEF